MACRRTLQLCRTGLLRKFDRQQQLRHSRSYGRDVAIIGAPFKKGQRLAGVEQGPRVMREAGLIEKLRDLGHNVEDRGDLNFDVFKDDPRNYVLNPKAVGAATKKVSKAVEQAVRDNKLTVTLGGDHSISIGTIHGHARAEPNLCLLWIDAHADINTPLTTPSGNIHGTPLSFLVNQLKDTIPWAALPSFDWLQPCLNITDIAFVGLRDLDPGERYILQKFNITSFSIHEVDRFGIHEVIARSLEAVNPKGDRPIHMSFDIDSVDPAATGATGTPVPGGLTFREGMFIAEHVYRTGLLSALDLVEVNPEVGSRQDKVNTVMTAVEVLTACLGKKREGNLLPGYQLPMP
ncbi:ARG2 [Branchiostoma lanceolatum]|uniref:Arginase n=2 Tax=Branchiostoma lanceolatum TaxID=7740 RepID=A0A8J9ZQM7_BRALA|nr:ARG2 [Branchiostoma lanceolatum]